MPPGQSPDPVHVCMHTDGDPLGTIQSTGAVSTSAAGHSADVVHGKAHTP
jgi:hypothetical protein